MLEIRVLTIKLVTYMRWLLTCVARSTPYTSSKHFCGRESSIFLFVTVYSYTDIPCGNIYLWWELHFSLVAGNEFWVVRKKKKIYADTYSLTLLPWFTFHRFFAVAHICKINLRSSRMKHLLYANQLSRRRYTMRPCDFILI